MPVTELYAFNLTCVILLMALYGVALREIHIFSTAFLQSQTTNRKHIVHYYCTIINLQYLMIVFFAEHLAVHLHK